MTDGRLQMEVKDKRNDFTVVCNGHKVPCTLCFVDLQKKFHHIIRIKGRKEIPYREIKKEKYTTREAYLDSINKSK